MKATEPTGNGFGSDLNFCRRSADADIQVSAGQDEERPAFVTEIILTLDRVDILYSTVYQTLGALIAGMDGAIVTLVL